MLALKKYNGDIWDRVYDDLFDSSLWGEERRFSPRTDIVENEKGFDITVEVPGFNEKDLKVSLHKGVLSIIGERESSKEEKDNKNYLRRERFSSRFERQFIIPDNADEKTLTAKLEKGVLKLTVGKKEEEKPTVIEIK